MRKTALITGITGQDGSYLAKLLLGKGYRVCGAHRRSASTNLWRCDELGITQDIEMFDFELLEFSNIVSVFQQVKPDEVYNLAAQSFVAASFEQPLYTAEVDAMGVARLLEAIRLVNPKIHFYQASTAELFGKVQSVPQTEDTVFWPRSPYGVAKLYAHWITRNYREAFDIHTSAGILFNHESPMRGLDFVTRKITAGFARISLGQQDCIELGNLDAQRDWGFAGDFVDGMWRMLQQPEGDEYILATGVVHSVRRFVELAAEAAGIPLAWEGEAEHTLARDRRSGRVVVKVNPKFYRPAEIDLLVGDPAKARTRLGWEPTVQLPALVQMMVEADLRRAQDKRIQ